MMTFRRGTRTGALLAVIALAACGPDASTPGSTSTSADTTYAIRTALIGSVDGAAEYLFGDITSVAVGPAGHVYIADRQGSTVRAYSPEGLFVALIGGEGDGPGEFQWPNDLAFDPEGRLWVQDGQRITVFAARAPDAVTDSVVYTIRLPGYGNTGSRRSWTDGTRYYYPGGRSRDPVSWYYVVFDTLGPTGDTVRVPPGANLEWLGTAFFRVSRSDGMMLPGVNRAPFEPVGTWAVTPRGTIIASPGDRSEVVEVTPDGDTVRTIRLPSEPISVPPAEREESLRVFSRRLDSIPVPLDRVIGMSDAARARALPATLPAVLQVHAAGDEIWLQRWPRADRSGETVYDVVGAEGKVARTVIVPMTLLRDPPPFILPTLVAGVVRDSATDVEMVAVFRIR